MSALDLAYMNTNKRVTDDPVYTYSTEDGITDFGTQPIIEIPNTLDLIGNQKLVRKGTAYGRYKFNGIEVPRVTSIIDTYCNNDIKGLMNYAAKLGKYYYRYNSSILFIGTEVHKAIAEFLISGTTDCLKNLDFNEKEICTAFNNFMSWYKEVTEGLGWKVEILLSEIPLISPWCGGTADAILLINGNKVLVDFKTSKRIDISYWIQVSAYRWIINNYYPEYGPINGVGILRFSKYYNEHECILYDLSIPENLNFINDCERAFGTGLNMFYEMNILRQEIQDCKRIIK